MKIVKVEPGKRARICDIEPNLATYQKTVGGLIECIYPFNDPVCIVANEEGKMNGSELNRALKDERGNLYDIIAGTFFICGLTEDDFRGLTDEEAAKYRAKFDRPEIFINNGRGIVALTI